MARQRTHVVRLDLRRTKLGRRERSPRRDHRLRVPTLGSAAVSIPIQYAADRPLVIADVVPYAKKGCEKCRGAGFYISIFHKGGAQESREPQACRCTTKRFTAEHGNDL